MTEPTRPLADGPLATAGASALNLESVPDPVASLVLVLGDLSAAALDVPMAPREVTSRCRQLVRELGIGARPLRHDELSLISDETRSELTALLPGGPTHLDEELGIALLPLWRSLFADELRIVVILREPSAIAAQAETEGSEPALALARYEAQLRSILEGANQLDVEFVRHTEIAGEGADGVPDELDALVDLAGTLVGRHRSFVAPPLPPASAFGSALLALAGDLDRATRGLEFLATQLETVLRIEVEQQPLLEAPQHREPVEEEIVEPTDDGRYPPDASQDRVAYHRWLAARREPLVVGGVGDAPITRPATPAPRRAAPLVSILVPVFRPPLWVLKRCVGSVLAQTNPSWELCLVDDGSAEPQLSEYLATLPRLDPRIRVDALAQSGGISAATNLAFARTSAAFVAYLDHDDELTPDAIDTVARYLASHPEADLLYSDEDKIDEEGERFDPLFKPEWSPDLLLSFAYTCHLSVMRREVVAAVGGLRSSFDGSQDYDLALRVSERARQIVHIPEILYHWRRLPGSAAGGAEAKPWAYEAGRRAIEDAMVRRGEEAEVTEHPLFPGRYHVRRRPTSRPLVSAIIPFRDEPALLATCAASLREAPGYDRLELVLVDNASELPETAALLDELREQPGVRIVSAPGPFNWAAINNAAAREAAGEVLLFMNNDIEARVPGWLDALLGHALRPEVGAVGARLVYPDGAIQHAGVVIGLGGIAGHVLRGLPPQLPGYNSMAISTRNCSVVTGACMMVRREIFEAVGGFDEELAVAFNDVDFCLKLREQGHLVVYTPLAELVHHESRSRGHTDDLEENQRIRERWEDALVAGDPYMNVHLSHWRYWCPLSTAQEDYRWKVYLETPPELPDSSPTT